MELTIDAIMRAYDQVWDIPEETHWLLCHPDRLEEVRAIAGAPPPGKHTCPVVRAHYAMDRGTVLRIKIGEIERGMWHYRR